MSEGKRIGKSRPKKDANSYGENKGRKRGGKPGERNYSPKSKTGDVKEGRSVQKTRFSKSDNSGELRYKKKEDSSEERTIRSKSDRSFKQDGKPEFKRSKSHSADGLRNYGDSRKLSKKPVQKEKKPDSDIRLNKYIANAGVCSRREADEYIKAGAVTVNGKVVSELGSKIKQGDVVNLDGHVIKPEKKVYILLNKPKDFVTTVDDPHATRTVMDLIKHACDERVYPVGRLDRNSTGVLLFTNDGELTKRLTHPKYRKRKIYHIHLDKNMVKTDMQKLVEGIELEDGLAQADMVSFPDESDKKQVGIEIHSGKNRIIRRMMESLGYKVLKLDRVYFAGLTKKNLPRGKWRFLSSKEINLLMMNAFA
jgi:23S rRNA pseudouridine2605 synthase